MCERQLSNSCVPSEDFCEKKPSGEPICYTRCRRRKERVLTSKSSSVISTYVSPKGMEEESVFSFEKDNNPSGYSTRP
ncbi:hypothetical protein TNCV_4347821 [Trichonephila clavipes]|nr:hypothetical protein TNCV_4347821 [Trichonephila clavipes]